MCLQASARRTGSHYSMPESGPGEVGKRRTTGKVQPQQQKDEVYKPHRSLKLQQKSSPYYTRKSTTAEAADSSGGGEQRGRVTGVEEDEEDLVEVSEVKLVTDGTKGDADMSGDVVAFLKAMAERDAQRQAELDHREEERMKREEVHRDETMRQEQIRKEEMARVEEARRQEEERRRERDAETRKLEMLELFRQMGELEKDKNEMRRAAEAERRTEEERKRQKREDHKDKLAGISVFRDSGDLVLFLENFEFIMRECEVPKEGWVSKLYPKLSERLCARVRPLVDEGVDYCAVKSALLKAVGETVATYGHKLFNMTGDSVKSMSPDQIVDLIQRNAKGPGCTFC